MTPLSSRETMNSSVFANCHNRTKTMATRGSQAFSRPQTQVSCVHHVCGRLPTTLKTYCVFNQSSQRQKKYFHHVNFTNTCSRLSVQGQRKQDVAMFKILAPKESPEKVPSLLSSPAPEVLSPQS